MSRFGTITSCVFMFNLIGLMENGILYIRPRLRPGICLEEITLA